MIYKILNIIDCYLEKKTKREIVILYMLIIALLVGIFYIFAYSRNSTTLDKLNYNFSNSKSLYAQIKNNYLMRLQEYNTTHKNIKQLEYKADTLSKDKIYADNKIKALKALIKKIVLVLY